MHSMHSNMANKKTTRAAEPVISYDSLHNSSAVNIFLNKEEANKYPPVNFIILRTLTIVNYNDIFLPNRMADFEVANHFYQWELKAEMLLCLLSSSTFCFSTMKVLKFVLGFFLLTKCDFRLLVIQNGSERAH